MRTVKSPTGWIPLLLMMLLAACLVFSVSVRADAKSSSKVSSKQQLLKKNSTEKRVTGLVKRPEDKQWVYVQNGVFKKATGIVKRLTDKQWVFVRNGVFSKETGLAKRLTDGEWMYVKNGVFKRGTGYTTIIGNDKTVFHYKNGKLSRSAKPFTGVYNGKYYKNNRKVLAFTPDDWIAFLDGIHGKGLTVKNGVLTKDQSEVLRKAMNAVRADTKVYGFIAVNTKTGRTISYNADFETSSMSTIKAPFLVSLCVYGAKGLPKYEKEIQRILQNSDNACYDALLQKYGTGYVSAFMESAGVTNAYIGGGYTSYSARSLAKIWCRIKQALETKRGDINLIQKYLLFHTFRNKNIFQDYYKKGWWYMDPKNGSVLNCGGCGKDWVYAVMSHPRAIYTVPENTQDRLISALYYALH